MTKQKALFQYLLRLGDNYLILGHRLSEWTGHGPMLEEEMAMCNMALDYLGQASAFYKYAVKIEGKGKTEDDLVYWRNEREYYNTLLAEQPNGDYAQTIIRQVLIDSYDIFFLEELKKSSDETLAAIAAKSLKEAQYHFRHSSSLAERLGNGTAESHSRMQRALNHLWQFTDEMFEMNEEDNILLKENIAVNLSAICPLWNKKTDELLQLSSLQKPENVFMQRGSRESKHTEHLGHLLAEMQHLHRTYPGVQW